MLLMFVNFRTFSTVWLSVVFNQDSLGCYNESRIAYDLNG